MGLEHKTKNLFHLFASSITTPREIFYFFTHTLLSLFLPLSFLLLAKLLEIQFYLQRINFWHQKYYYSSPQNFSYILKLALHINPFILYFLVFIISISSLIHALTNKIINLSNNSSTSSCSSNIVRPRLYIAWILLCVFQVCVGLGIEGSILVGLYDSESSSFGVERSFLSRVVFLLGLHETTRVWCRMVVKPVVDDTVFGGVIRKERWVEKLGVDMCLGILWWWKLRDDVENLVIMSEAKKDQLMDVGINDFVGWCLYYLTVTIGMVKVVKGLMWILAQTRLLYVEDPISLFGALKTRNITPVTVFRGDLELSPKLRIKVMVYKKTQEEKFPTLKKFSDKAPQTDKFATHEVKVDYEYKSSADPDKVVPPDQRIKGYRYGPQIIPISSAEWDAVKFKPEKGVKLLGFTDSSNILRHQYMKDVYVFIAEPGNTKAVLAVSALSRAMKEMNKVAILRCVWRQGQANVVIGVLTPNVSDRENLPDSFYFNILPFAEDVREFQFPSFSSFPASCQPNEQQLESAANFIKMLDLAPDGKQEVLLPDFTPNPVLARFYHYLDLKSKHPDASVPPLDYTLRKITEPETDLVLQNQSVIDSYRRSFEMQGNPLKKPRRFLRGKTSDEEGKENITAPPANLIEYTSIKVEKIGDLTPVQDFEAMISRRDSPDWVVKAIKDMKDKIFDMVEDSHEGDNYPKALDCLVALRKGCILEQEPKQFNDFLKHLCNFCQEKNLQSFCEHLAAKGLTLIPKTEAIDSDVSDEEARSFLVKSESKCD